jgi:hypothetical protein
LVKSIGFLSEEDADSFSLKCTPCFLSDRKWDTFVVAVGSGDPGGDGGISRFGIGGNVRSCIKASDVVYREESFVFG